MAEIKEAKENGVWALLQELASKKGITEVAINGPKTVFVEREGQFIQLNVNLTKNDMYGFIKEVAEYNRKVCDEQNPLMDGNLPDGSRINVVVEPFSHGSPAITIRKYLKSLRTFDTAGGSFGLSTKWVTFFKAMVVARQNTIVSGGTGVGKTTFMNMLLHEMPMNERIVSIEDTLELDIGHPNVVRLEAKSSYGSGSKTSISTRDLVKNALRMRPDRIVIGEVRGGELFDLLQAMNTGHDGSMSSMHSNSPGECLGRMENLFMMAGFEVPSGVIRRQLSTAVNFIVQVGRDREGHRRVTQVAEITGMEANTIQMQTIGKLDEGELKFTGIAPKVMRLLNERAGLPLDFFV